MMGEFTSYKLEEECPITYCVFFCGMTVVGETYVNTCFNEILFLQMSGNLKTGKVWSLQDFKTHLYNIFGQNKVLGDFVCYPNKCGHKTFNLIQ